MPAGRPSLYSEDVASEICRRLIEGEPLRKICKSDGMPSRFAVFEWLEKNEEFATRYARARELLGDHLAEELLEIVDVEPDAAKARVRLEARRWFASKVAPKKYGDRLTNEHVGADGGPLTVRWVKPEAQDG